MLVCLGFGHGIYGVQTGGYGNPSYKTLEYNE